MTPYYEREEWAGWLASIREQPDDDHRRLFCADWLDGLETEEAVERSEFIRVQVELAKPQFFTRAGNPRLRRKRAARERARELLIGHAPGWMPGIMVVTSPKWTRPPGDDSAAVWYERGFVTRVSAPLSALHGGECGRCGADGEDDGLHSCTSCHGAGRTPGVLGQLLRREPITAAGIEVTGREPRPNSADEDSVTWWGWYVVGELAERERYDLPAELADYMPPTSGNGSRWRRYPTADAARLALGEALYRLHSPKSEVLT